MYKKDSGYVAKYISPKKAKPRSFIPPGNLLNPVSVVMVSCQEAFSSDHAVVVEESSKTSVVSKNLKTNIITIAWAGTLCSDPPLIGISIRPERYSHALIKETKEYVVNLVDTSLLKACDWCGVKSGREVDKFKAFNLTPGYGEKIRKAPYIMESPVSLGCKVVQIISLGTHDLFIGEIVEISAKGELLDRKGKLCLEKADLIAYLHGEYVSLGEKQGFFGFSVANAGVMAKRMPKGMPKGRLTPTNKKIKQSSSKNNKKR